MKKIKWLFNKDTKCRYALGYLKKNPLICIGTNPSTATPACLDHTVKRVSQFANMYDYDSWIMINLYPQISTNPKQVDLEMDVKLHERNILEIKKMIQKCPKQFSVWAAWGNLITTRDYLKNCLIEIIHEIGEHENWFQAGNVTKCGHPRHPLYLPKSIKLQKFDVRDYLKHM